MFVYIPTMATGMVEAQKKMDKTLLVFIKFKFFNPFDYLKDKNYLRMLKPFCV